MATSKIPDRRPTGPRLRPDDIELWRRVAGTARPLKRGKDRRAPVARTDTAAADAPGEMRREAPAAAAAAEQTAKHAPPAPKRPPPLGGFDRREARQLAGGRLAIDARLDLHGMKRREAHAALKAFLSGAHAQGHRLALVITGKGGARLGAADAFAEGRAVERGVLKRDVPRWLAGAEFRQFVVSYTEAGPRHGGAGALYVRLRRTTRQA